LLLPPLFLVWYFSDIDGRLYHFVSFFDCDYVIGFLRHPCRIANTCSLEFLLIATVFFFSTGLHAESPPAPLLTRMCFLSRATLLRSKLAAGTSCQFLKICLFAGKPINSIFRWLFARVLYLSLPLLSESKSGRPSSFFSSPVFVQFARLDN